MKNILKLLILLLLPTKLFGFTTSTMEVTIVRGKMAHTYLVTSAKKQSTLVLKNGVKDSHTKNISEAFADRLIAEANRVAWTSAYRKPASKKTCTGYATITLNKEKPIVVCQENLRATGYTYGFLNKLNRLIKN